MPTSIPLSPEDLRRPTDPGQFDFEDTSTLEDLDHVIGQERVLEAVEVGTGIAHPGFNLFALGVVGLGKHTLIQEFLKRRAAKEEAPGDWCYVHDFADARRPRALALPRGRGRAFHHSMEQLVDELRGALPALFESDDYQMRRELIESELKTRQEEALESIRAQALERGVMLINTPVGFTMAPEKDGRPLAKEDFDQLPEAEQNRLRAVIDELEGTVQAVLGQIPEWEKQHRERIRELNREVTQLAVGYLINAVRREHGSVPGILEYLDTVENDVIHNAARFIESGAPAASEMIAGEPSGDERGEDGLYARYQVNLVVDNAELEGAPVVYEEQPTLTNLTGRVEFVSRFGALVTDFTLIKPGAFHAANGGYLIMDARKVLQRPFAWENLKTTLRSREIRFQSIDEMLGAANTVSLDPVPIPLRVKVVLVGEPLVYYLLCAHDPEFADLFKVALDFQDRMPREAAAVQDYARLLGTLARREGLRPLTADGVACALDHSARRAGDAEKLSLELRDVADVIREADFRAARENRSCISRAEIEGAIEARIWRSDRLRERIQEEIERGTILIATEGVQSGQVNALSVLQLGGFAFGRPSRVTARVRLGKGEVIDIEREVELGGAIHSKGILILTGFLGGRFGAERPLAFSANLVFEQSYGGVDGDSASLAETSALLSELAGIPIRQDLAITGSMRIRHGAAQAVGGVNEKIEGFFEVCNARGLTGSQGVIIPRANVSRLMLREEVVEAVRAGRFSVHAVESVDEALELLTGVDVGACDTDGSYPPESINGRVVTRLERLSERVRFERRSAGSENGENSKNIEKSN